MRKGMAQVARLFREARKALGMTQAEFAELLGVQQHLISRYENGNVNPQGNTTVKAMEIFLDHKHGLKNCGLPKR